jgi:hypothetical protein
MNYKTTIFYLGLACQLFGLASVGLCFFAGLKNGDYGRIELVQFIGGGSIFYLGQFLRSRSS